MTEDFARAQKVGQRWFVFFNFGRAEHGYAEVNEATARKVAAEATEFLRVQIKEAVLKTLAAQKAMGGKQ